MAIAAGLSDQNWQVYAPNGLFINVDTSSARFAKTPVYVASIQGTKLHWAITGGSAIYFPTATSFRIYVRFPDGRNLTPAEAVEWGWRVAWHGIET